MIATIDYEDTRINHYARRHETYVLITNDQCRDDLRYFWLNVIESSFEPKDGFTNQLTAKQYLLDKVAKIESLKDFRLEDTALRTYFEPKESDKEDEVF